MTASPGPRPPRRTSAAARSAGASTTKRVNGATAPRPPRAPAAKPPPPGPKDTADPGTAEATNPRPNGARTYADEVRVIEPGAGAPGDAAVPAIEVSVPPLPDVAESAEPEGEPLPADRYLNRELSWLDFNARVLTLAQDPQTPLLERAKFLAIFASNLDEFYMLRVAGLKRRQQTGLAVRGTDGLFPREQLERIAERAAMLVSRHARCFAEDVQPALAAENIRVVRWADLAAAERERMRAYFREQVFPVLTPLAVDPAHPFPYISGLSLNLAVAVRDPDGNGSELFARVKVPNNVPRFVSVDRDRAASSAEGPRLTRFLPVEDLIAVHLGQLFSGMQVVEHHVFRVTRNADFELDEDRDEDLLQALERELARRRFGPPVRLEVDSSISDHVLELLVRELDMDAHDVMRVPALLDLSSLWQVYNETDRPDLKDRPFVPATHPMFAEGEIPRSVFARLRDNDILVHHPYHSFSTSVQRFIEQAAADPLVLAIKQTLYRTSGDSPIVDALVAAAEAGKQVVVLVEVQARFDEQANIGWARMLERAGCHVVYGLVGLKTHCKTALVVRQEGNQIRRYCHIGTGNYHPKTARLYEDFGLLTADPEVGADLTDLFNMLTGYSRQTAYRRLLVAPYGVRSGLIERIDREIEHVRDGRYGLVQMKANSLVDEEIVDALYRASRAGVDVDLIIRGICTLKPGVPGLSDRIRVRSILGRFLEHSRVFRFGDGQTRRSGQGAPRGETSRSGETARSGEGPARAPDGEFWIGSADLMHRNLGRRVEALVHVTDPAARVELDRMIGVAMDERTAAFELAGDGTWHRRVSAGEQPLVDPQEALLRRIVDRVE